MRTKLKFSTTFHPTADGQLERANQTLEDIVLVCALQFKVSWNDFIPLMEFTYNNIYYSSIEMTHYKTLYGRKCTTPIC